MNTPSLFGRGFIGNWYMETYPAVEVHRQDIYSPTPEILYMRSTVHNYHPKDGDPFEDIRTNLVHFMEVLEENRKLHKEMVFNLVSTWFVYGQTKLPAAEDSPCNPTGFYSITALAREQLLKSYAETIGFKYRILRLGNVIGVGDKKASLKKNALQHFCRELAQGREVSIYKKGSIRDYIDVRDCVSAIHLVLEKGKLNETYNIANGLGLNTKDLIYTAWEHSGYLSKINEIDVPDFHKSVQTPIMWMSAKKIRELGYIQQYDIEQTVRSLVDHYMREK